MKFNDEVTTPDGQGVVKGFESESYEGFPITTTKPERPTSRVLVRVAGKIRAYQREELKNVSTD